MQRPLPWAPGSCRSLDLIICVSRIGSRLGGLSLCCYLGGALTEDTNAAATETPKRRENLKAGRRPKRKMGKCQLLERDTKLG